MKRIDESNWVDLTSQDDRDSGRARFVKTLGVEGGFGRAMRIEIVAEGGMLRRPAACRHGGCDASMPI